MTYMVGTLTIGMPMTYANVQKTIVIWVVPYGTYLVYKGK